MLIAAALLALLFGTFVAVFTEQRGVRAWFFATCASASALCVGLFLEVHHPAHAFFAARLDMTAALACASGGLLSARALCGLRVRPAIVAMLGVAAAVNVATVWATQMYFTGAYVQYDWGGYVAGNPRFLANPLLVALIAGYAVWTLARGYRSAHPLDKNRTKYVLVAYAFLGLSVLDYLPHFGIAPFRGPVCTLTVPLFVVVFGYASLRYRQLEFRGAAARAAAWVVAAVVVVAGYVTVLAAAERVSGREDRAVQMVAAVAMAIAFAALGRVFTRVVLRVVGDGAAEIQVALGAVSDEIATLLDEAALRKHVAEACRAHLGAADVAVLDAAAVASSATLAEICAGGRVVELEVLRRVRGAVDSVARGFDLLVPLLRHQHVVGALAVGPRQDGRMYTEAALHAFRTIGNLYTMAEANARRAAELARRHDLDRYLPPQIVERILAGHRDALEARRRTVITAFFSDLKGFTPLAEALEPEKLSLVLNEYLSEMAEIAFAHGGTVDKFIGDAVMVFFGAPIATDPATDAVRCVRMAIAMQRRVRELNARWCEAGLLSRGLESRMGAHTGEAIVGSFGSQGRVEYTAIGRTVNLASRLEGVCTPGRIAVSAATWELVRGSYRASPRGVVQVKGFAEPVELFEIDPDASPSVAPTAAA